jgi:hypothetical protein
MGHSRTPTQNRWRRVPGPSDRRLRALASQRGITTERNGSHETPPTPIADSAPAGLGSSSALVDYRSACYARLRGLMGRWGRHRAAWLCSAGQFPGISRGGPGAVDAGPQRSEVTFRRRRDLHIGLRCRRPAVWLRARLLSPAGRPRCGRTRAQPCSPDRAYLGGNDV